MRWPAEERNEFRAAINAAIARAANWSQRRMTLLGLLGQVEQAAAVVGAPLTSRLAKE